MIFAVQIEAILKPVPSTSQLHLYHIVSYGKAWEFIREEAKRGYEKDSNISEIYF